MDIVVGQTAVEVKMRLQGIVNFHSRNVVADGEGSIGAGGGAQGDAKFVQTHQDSGNSGARWRRDCYRAGSTGGCGAPAAEWIEPDTLQHRWIVFLTDAGKVADDRMAGVAFS